MMTLDAIRAALTLPGFDGQAAQYQMAPQERRGMAPLPEKPPRQSAVLALIYPNADDRLHILLTRRAERLRGHSGQISFPGGRRDPQDASYEATALRETCEEVGVCGDEIEILGQLTPLWIPPSNFHVVPFVGTIPYRPVFQPNPDEVAEILSLPLAQLLSAGLKCSTSMSFRGKSIEVPYYDVSGHVVWGATCMMLSELEQRLRVALRLVEE